MTLISISHFYANWKSQLPFVSHFSNTLSVELANKVVFAASKIFCFLIQRLLPVTSYSIVRSEYSWWPLKSPLQTFTLLYFMKRLDQASFTAGSSSSKKSGRAWPLWVWELLTATGIISALRFTCIARNLYLLQASPPLSQVCLWRDSMRISRSEIQFAYIFYHPEVNLRIAKLTVKHKLASPCCLKTWLSQNNTVISRGVTLCILVCILILF